MFNSNCLITHFRLLVCITRLHNLHLIRHMSTNNILTFNQNILLFFHEVSNGHLTELEEAMTSTAGAKQVQVAINHGRISDKLHHNYIQFPAWTNSIKAGRSEGSWNVLKPYHQLDNGKSNFPTETGAQSLSTDQSVTLVQVSRSSLTGRLIFYR